MKTLLPQQCVLSLMREKELHAKRDISNPLMLALKRSLKRLLDLSRHAMRLKLVLIKQNVSTHLMNSKLQVLIQAS